MFFYLDSSVFIKKYFEEIGTDAILKIWKTYSNFAISQVGYSEILGTINKKQKIEKFTDSSKKSLLKQFKSDWDQMLKINVDHSMIPELDKIHSNHLLRGFDAVHLASALLLFRELKEEFLFLSADDQLCNAAKKFGFNTGSYHWK